MKYHSTFSTIIISLAVLLVFSSVALFTVFSLSMTSPTLILTNELMEKLESSGSDFSISFDRIDRNLRDGVSITGLEIGYRGEKAASFEHITAHMGFFQIIRYLVMGTGNLVIEAENGSISVTDSMISGGGGDGGKAGGAPDLSFLDRYSLSLHLHGFDITLPEGIRIGDAEASFYLDHGIEGFHGNLRTGDIEYTGDGYSALVSGFLMTAGYDNGLKIAFSGENAALTYGPSSVEAGNIIVQLSLLPDYSYDSLSFSFSSLSGSHEEVFFSAGQSSAEFSGEGASFVITDISAEYGTYSASVARADAVSPDLSSFSVIITSLAAADGDDSIFSARRIEADGDVDDGRYSLFTPECSFSIPGSAGGLVPRVTARSVQADVEEHDGLWSFSASTRMTASSPDTVLDGTRMGFSADGSFTEDGITELRLNVNNLILPYLSDPLSAGIVYRDGEARLTAMLGSRLSIRGLWGDSPYLHVSMNDLALADFRPYVSEYFPVFLPYIGEETEVAGTVSVSLADDGNGNLTGPMNASVILSDIRFNQYSFSAAVSLSSSLVPGRIDVSSLALTTDFIRASWNGYIDLERMLPAGDFTVSRTSTGEEMFLANLTLSESDEYFFSASIPYFTESWFRGRVDFNVDGLVRSDAVLRSGGTEYPFDLTVDLVNQMITLDNEDLDISVEYGEVITGSAAFRSFELPVPSGDVRPSSLSGDIALEFSFAGQSLSIDVPSFQIVNMRHLPTAPDLSFSAHADNDGMEFTDIILAGVETEPLRGMISVSYEYPSFALYLASQRTEDREEIMISVAENEGVYAGILEFSNFNLARLGLEGFVGSASLTGRGGSLEDLSFAGSIDAGSYDMINDPRTLRASLEIDMRSIELSDIEYQNGSFHISSDILSYSSETGEFSTSASLSYAIANEDRDYPISASLSLSGFFGSGDTIIGALLSFRNDGLPSSADLVLSGLTLDNRIRTDERSLHIEYMDGRFTFTGTLAGGYYDTADKSFDLAVDIAPAAAFRASGSLSDNSMVAVDIEKFEVSIANLFMPEPTVIFYDPAPVRGHIDAVKNGSEWILTGFLEADSAAFDVFWMPDERVILHNPTFYIWDNMIQSNVDDCTVLDLKTYERIPGRVSLYLDLSDTLSFEGWGVDVWAYDGKEVGIRLPMPESNVDIWGTVSGHLVIQSDGRTVYLGGDLTADDLTMSLGMEPLPEWWGSDKATRIDFNLLLRENVKFVFPLGPDPILTATLAENQRLHVIIDEYGGMDISGNLNIRSGEFFYFQKNFYITEGNISFRSREYGEGGFDPLINLRARLRDFDSEGREVDIYLILRNSTLDNINPTFESSPSKDLNEIMSILGGAILPSTAYGEVSVSSVFSLFSSSVDILSRMGIIRPVDIGLEQSIRQALSLDTFSLHTNIVENILYDTVSLVASSLEDTLSPMARYLNGTTLYLGKYLTPSLYLEGMIHLSAAEGQNERKHTFIADDLNIDIEVSLEWENPMCTFRFFTQPVNITVYDIVDSFGFGFSKRIVW